MAKPQSVARGLSTFSRNAGFPALTLVWLAACGGVDGGTPDNDFVPAVVEWNLVFEDDFDGDTLDTSKWNIDEGQGPECATDPDKCGWGNEELQVYSADNIEVSGGTLKLIGQQELDGSYTSARINSQGKFDFTYGKVEVRARIPAGQGTWPAIWALHSPAGGLNPAYGDVGIYGPWPLSGEIDIMEAFNYGAGDDQRTENIRSTTHYGLDIEPFDGTGSFSEKNGLPLTPNADLQFYVYGMEWENGRIRFFVDQDSLLDRDGQVTSNGHFQTQNIDEYYVYYPAGSTGFYDPIGAFRSPLSNAPFDQAFHLLLNFAIGGRPVGDPDPATIFPQSFEIDYVRVYECANSNPDTRRGCGSLDPNVGTLEDLDGTPLEDATTASPYIETLDLFIDAPELITVNFGTDVATNQLSAEVGFAGGGATVVNDTAAVDPDDPANTVWRVAVSGDVANVLLTGEDKTGDEVLGTGFDFSSSATNDGNPAPVGEVVFDMYVTSIDPATNLVIKLDSGFPNLGEVVLDQADLEIGAWKTYSVKFRDFLANPGFAFDPFFGTGVDLENVLNPFVFEVAGGNADVFLDNIRVTNACYVVGECSAGPITLGLPDVIIFDDAVNTATWDLGINGASSEDGFAANYTDGTLDRKAQWAIIDDPDDVAARGQIIDITYKDDNEFGIMFIGSSSGVDLSGYSPGAVEFDIYVENYGNSPAMTFKVDGANSSSGDLDIGRVGDGAWETVQVPASRLTGAGLNLSEVTAAVFFPTSPQTGGISFRIDNMRWIDEADAPPLNQIDLPVTFDDPMVDYTLINFEGTGTSLIADPDNASNMVASTTKGPGGQDFAGTVIGTSAGFANPIPFAPGDTTMSIRVRAPAPGIGVTLQVENAANDDAVRRQVTTVTTTMDAWETLTFDFSTVGLDTNEEFVRSVLFFDLGTVGNGETYLWDDVEFGAGGGGGPGPQGAAEVFGDTVDPVWDVGIAGTESPNFATTTDGTLGPVTTWSVVPATDTNRGDVIQATIGGIAPEFGLLFIQSSAGVDLSAYANGAVVFDILVTDYGTNTNGMLMKIDCVFPCTSGDQVLGVVGDGRWETVVVPISQLVASGLNLATVNTGIAVYPDIADQQGGAAVTFQIDDVRWEPNVPMQQAVYIDAVDPVWDFGLAGTESPNFATTTDGTLGPVTTWAEVAAADPARGQVVQAIIGGNAPEFGLFFIQSTGPVDVSAFARGSVVFDILVTDYGTNTNGMIMKIDCGFPCTSGDQPIGVVGDGAWETVTVEVSQLVNSGLNLATVNTGIVIFPDVADQQAGATVTFQIDNAHWEP